MMPLCTHKSQQITDSPQHEYMHEIVLGMMGEMEHCTGG